MLVGTHNSMTYLKPKKWWMRLFNFMAQCQSKSIQDQYFIYGVKYYDFRIYFDGDTPIFKHGLIEYIGDVINHLKFLNSLNEQIYVRILLETSKEDIEQENKFCLLCDYITIHFTNIKLQCGRRKFDWKQIVKLPEFELDQKVASMTGTILDDWFPWLYARLFNKKNIKKGTDKQLLLIDFINIQ